jgi:hypothetical protein
MPIHDNATDPVWGDVTVIDLADSFDDVLTTPIRLRDRELAALLAPSAITIPPSDLPAADLPDYEPTSADLLAIEFWDDDLRIDARIGSANTLAAYEARHRELCRLRELTGVAAGDLDDPDDDRELERAA